jgi:hypothetical protein
MSRGLELSATVDSATIPHIAQRYQVPTTWYPLHGPLPQVRPRRAAGSSYVLSRGGWCPSSVPMLMDGSGCSTPLRAPSAFQG